MSYRFLETDAYIFPFKMDVNDKEIDKIPNEIYELSYSEKMGMVLVKNAKPILPSKIYGNIPETANMILNTFQDRKDKTTGVLLSGLKGTGKTLLANYLVNNAKYPVFKITTKTSIKAQIDFLKELDFPYILLIDEYEKKINDDDKNPNLHSNQQNNENIMHNLLTFLDGEDTKQKLAIFIVNDIYQVSEYLKERPSRIYYHFRYTGLSEADANEIITDYLTTNYPNKNKLKDVIKMVYNEIELMLVFNNLTFDMLSALLEEVCRYPNKNVVDILSIMNIGYLNSTKGVSIKIKYLDDIYNYPQTPSIKIDDFNLTINFNTLLPNNNYLEIRDTITSNNFMYRKNNEIYFSSNDPKINLRGTHDKTREYKKFNKEDLIFIIKPLISIGWEKTTKHVNSYQDWI